MITGRSLLGASLGDGGKTGGVRMIVCDIPSLVISERGVFFELSTGELGSGGSRGLKTKIRGNRLSKVTSRDQLGSPPYFSLLAEFQDRTSAVGQEVTLNVKDLGGIDERGGNW